MNLKDLYEKEGPSGLRRLADKTGANPQYLYQCATNRKEPSPKLARKLIAADERLTLDDIYLNTDAASSASDQQGHKAA